MSSKYFPVIEHWSLPEAALQDSMAEMARDGATGNEGMVLWLGHRSNGVGQITHLVALRGPDVVKHPAQLVIPTSIFADVADRAAELHVSLIGQIHSHGPGYGTDLSPTDRTCGVAVPYYLSLVAPDYAMRPHISLSECGVHVFEPPGGFRRLLTAEVHSRFVLTHNLRPPMLIVGEERYA